MRQSKGIINSVHDLKEEHLCTVFLKTHLTRPISKPMGVLALGKLPQDSITSHLFLDIDGKFVHWITLPNRKCFKAGLHMWLWYTRTHRVHAVPVPGGVHDLILAASWRWTSACVREFGRFVSLVGRVVQPTKKKQRLTDFHTETVAWNERGK